MGGAVTPGSARGLHLIKESDLIAQGGDLERARAALAADRPKELRTMARAVLRLHGEE